MEPTLHIPLTTDGMPPLGGIACEGGNLLLKHSIVFHKSTVRMDSPATTLRHCGGFKGQVHPTTHNTPPTLRLRLGGVEPTPQMLYRVTGPHDGPARTLRYHSGGKDGVGGNGVLY